MPPLAPFARSLDRHLAAGPRLLPAGPCVRARGIIAAAAPLLLLALSAACSVPVAGALSDAEANRILVTLDRANVDATREPDPAAEGAWRVEVANEDVQRALAAMQGEELPRRLPAGVLEAVGKGSLVPSEAAENAELAAGISGELERSLESIDGVLSARVHLSIPAPAMVRDSAPARGSASVLLEHRGATPPVSADSVQRLVAGGVAGLLPSDVAVVMVPRATFVGSASSDFAHVGPIAVARTSVRRLQAALAVLVAVVALLAAATLMLYSRLNRARAELARDASAPR
jgi:type III secretion protein J